jgi:hypothetical protein
MTLSGRSFLRAFAIQGVTGPHVCRAAGRKRRNIVLMMADDMGEALDACL